MTESNRKTTMIGQLIGQDVFTALLQLAGEDPERDGLKETPARAAKAWREWTSGYDVDPLAVLKVFEDGAEQADGLVFQAGIPFYSHCEHHLAPIFGVVHIGYIPNGSIVGLSKLARLTDIFAHRLTVQERMTNQIATTLYDGLKCKGVGVVSQARHLCMESRGVKKVGTVTMTQSLRGTFLTHPEVRAEFTGMAQTAMAGVRGL